MKYYLFILVYNLCTTIGYSQEWEKNYYTPIDFYGDNFVETYDKGILLLGYEKDDIIIGGKIILIKTDINGNELFRKSIGLIDDRFGVFLKKTEDNGFIIYGVESKYGIGNSLLMKFNSCFELEWTRVFGLPNEYDVVWDIVELEDGSFYSVNFFESDRIRVFKISAKGKVMFEKNFLPNGYDSQLGRNYGNAWARNISVTHDKGLLLGGNIYIEDYNFGGQYTLKSFVLKLDSTGNREWLYAFGVDSGYFNNQAEPIELADSSILVFCNFLHYPGVDGMVSYAYKLNKNGELLWHKLIDSVSQSNMDKVLLNDTTIYLLTSTNASQSSIDVEGRVRVLKIDTSGVLLDSATYAENKYSTTAESITATADHKLLICGQQYHNYITSAYVLKIQADLSIDTFSTAVLNYDYLCSEPIMSGHIAFDTALSIINIGNVAYELKVYPNPSQSYVCFEIEADKSLEYSLHIYNALGSLVYTQKEVKDKLLNVNVLDLSSGIYYYSIMHQDELVGSGQFVRK